jgi:hypothetical protein
MKIGSPYRRPTGGLLRSVALLPEYSHKTSPPVYPIATLHFIPGTKITTDFQIVIDVQRFDVTIRGLANLQASWTINDLKAKAFLLGGFGCQRISG